jgi:hypothetical protein
VATSRHSDGFQAIAEAAGLGAGIPALSIVARVVSPRWIGAGLARIAVTPATGSASRDRAVIVVL